MARESYRVGELARRTGVSVRTLHHYDAIGLLSPAGRSAAGHRLYGARDVQRLLHIRALAQLGFSLEEVRACLSQPEHALPRVLERHVARLTSHIAESQRLCQRLVSLLAGLRADETSMGDVLLTIEAMTMFEKYYTQEQMTELAERRAQLGEDTIRAVEAEWPELIAKMRAHMDLGTDPSAAEVQALARRWQELVAMFTGGDPGLRRSAADLLANEERARTRHGLDAALMEYVGRALIRESC